MPSFAWALLGLLWLIVATLILLPRVLSSRMPAGARQLDAIPAVFLILGKPGAVVAVWLLTAPAVGYLVTLAIVWSAARR